MGHISNKALQVLDKQELFKEDQVEGVQFCESCILGKQHRVSIATGTQQLKGILDYTTTTYGDQLKQKLMEVTLISYLSLMIIQGKFGCIGCIFLSIETFDKFKSWKIMIENQTDRKIKALRTNNGLEFCNREFNQFCKDYGIVKHRTVRFPLSKMELLRG